MNTVLKIFLSMSFSGSLLILALLWGKRFLQDKISRQWQYYIWLIVIMRLLLPFGSQVNLLGKAYQAVDRALAQAVAQDAPLPLTDEKGASDVPGVPRGAAMDGETDRHNTDSPAGTAITVYPFRDIVSVPVSLLAGYGWQIWLVVALVLLMRSITIYQSFIQYVNAELTPISDLGILDQLSIAAGRAGVKGPVELCVNPLVSSPLLIGFFHPCIVLPSVDISENDFRHIVLHELTHYKRRDMFYKWLVQVTVCLHWFNPLVHLMGREITRACEFSCDEAVLLQMGPGRAQDYGKTLLDAMAAVGKYRESPGAVTLGENKKLLKERIGAIMKYKGQSKAVKVLTAVLTLCVVLGAAFAGVYSIGFAAGNAHAANIPGDPAPGDADAYGKDSSEGSVYVTAPPALQEDDIIGETAQNPQSNAPTWSAASSASGEGEESADSTGAAASPVPSPDKEGSTATWAEQAERYYEANSLPLFEVVFSQLDGKAQGEWLDRIYADGEIAFFSVSIGQLNAGDPLIGRFAEKSYGDDSVSFFSVLANQSMSEDALETWLGRALEDGRISFQSVLFDALYMDAEKEALEEEWAEKQMEDYRAVGVTKKGKSYYYQEQLVNIFLDIRPNKSFYTLDINPAGTVNIKIIRDGNGEITGVTYMTEAEVAEILSDMEDS